MVKFRLKTGKSYVKMGKFWAKMGKFWAKLGKKGQILWLKWANLQPAENCSSISATNQYYGGWSKTKDFFAISLLLYNDNQQSMTHVLLENVMSLIMD